jgi:chromosomal replication initiation ATPase DnaA
MAINQAETRRALEKIGWFKGTLALAVDADQMYAFLSWSLPNYGYTDNILRTLALAIQDLSLSTKNTVLEIHENIRSTQTRTEQEAVRRWLSTPDPSTNYNRARQLRHPTNGSWFLKSEAFSRWKKQKSLLWLHGNVGCGKTILSSTVLIEILQNPRSHDGVAVVYFYFDFSDLEKQNSEKMIRSLVIQLSGQSRKEVTALKSCFSSCTHGERQLDIESL